MTMLLVRIPSCGTVPVTVIADHGQTLQVRLATNALVHPPEFDNGTAVISRLDVVKAVQR